MPLPGPLPLAHGERVLAVMYVADFLTQFHKLLGVRPLTYADLDRLADHGCDNDPWHRCETPESGWHDPKSPWVRRRSVAPL